MMCRQLMDILAEERKHFSVVKIIIIPSVGDSKEVSSIMANVSARIDDDLKARADAIADQIGISLSSAIGIFLKRFVAEQGFPFPVKAVGNNTMDLSDETISELAKIGIQNGKDVPSLPASFYIDPKTNSPKITTR